MIRRFGGGTHVLIGVAAFGAGFVASAPVQAGAGRAQRHIRSVRADADRTTVKHRVRTDAGPGKRRGGVRGHRVRFTSFPVRADADPQPPTPAQPQADQDDRGGHGNGTHNRNIFSVQSPTHNHGYQHTSTSTAGGRTNVQNGLCHHVVICNITQQADAKPAAPEPATTPVAPRLEMPKPVAPQVTPVPRGLPEVAPAFSFGPFFSIGPSGIMFSIPRSVLDQAEQPQQQQAKPAAEPAAAPPVPSDDRGPVAVEEAVQPVE